MLTLLKQLVYPTVEYNSVLWNPTDPTLIDALETIQRNFTRKIESTNHPTTMTIGIVCKFSSYTACSVEGKDTAFSMCGRSYMTNIPTPDFI